VCIISAESVGVDVVHWGWLRSLRDWRREVLGVLGMRWVTIIRIHWGLGVVGGSSGAIWLLVHG